MIPPPVSAHAQACIDAIRSQDFKKFKKHVRYAPLFYMESVETCDSFRTYYTTSQSRVHYCATFIHGNHPTEEFLTYLSLRKFFDINARKDYLNFSFLMACLYTSLKHMVLLVEAGCDIHVTASGMNAFSFASSWKNERERSASCALLLSVGVDPGNLTFKEEVKSQVEKWIKGLEAAKDCFEKIFDDQELEKTLCGFIFTEKHLHKALA